jgi:Zn-dependent alcohol dehydrogenase
MDMLIRGVTVKMITEGDADPKVFIPQLVPYHLAGKLPFDRLLKHYRLDQIDEAFDDAVSGKAIKPILVI